MHGAVERLARAGAGLANDPRGARQIRVGECTLLGEGMVRRAKDHELVRAPATDLELGLVQFTFDQSDVDFEVQHLSRDLGGIGDVERDARAGLIAHEAGDLRDHQVVADGERRAHA